MTGVDPFEERIQRNRIARNNRIYERQQIARRQRSPQEYVGYDAATGLHRLRGAEGDRLVPSITTGALEAGAIVRSGPGSVDGLQAAQPLVFESVRGKARPIPNDCIYIADGDLVRRLDMQTEIVSTLIDETDDWGYSQGVTGTRKKCIFTTRQHVIVQVQNGVSQVLAGKKGESTYLQDGIGSNARLYFPSSIDIGWNNEAYFVDGLTSGLPTRLRKINLATRQVTTLPDIVLSPRGISWDAFSNSFLVFGGFRQPGPSGWEGERGVYRLQQDLSITKIFDTSDLIPSFFFPDGDPGTQIEVYTFLSGTATSERIYAVAWGALNSVLVKVLISFPRTGLEYRRESPESRWDIPDVPGVTNYNESVFFSNFANLSKNNGPLTNEVWAGSSTYGRDDGARQIARFLKGPFEIRTARK